jgi:hypothetical protein
MPRTEVATSLTTTVSWCSQLVQSAGRTCWATKKNHTCSKEFLTKGLFSTVEGQSAPVTVHGAFHHGTWESNISVRVSCSRWQRRTGTVRPDSMLEDANVTDERQVLKAGLLFGKRRPGLDIATC